jgi:hypothetical protein
MSESNIETAKISADAAAEELSNVGPVSEVAVFDERNDQEREERLWRCQPGSNLDLSY